MNKLIYILISIFFIISNVFAHELSFKHDHGKWSFKKVNGNACSIFQIPLTEKGDYTQRGTVLFYVFKDDNAEYVELMLAILMIPINMSKLLLTEIIINSLEKMTLPGQ